MTTRTERGSGKRLKGLSRVGVLPFGNADSSTYMIRSA